MAYMNSRKASSTAVALVLITLFLAAPCFPIALDGTFGSGGKFTATFSETGDPSTSGARVFVQPSGRVVAIGRHNQQAGEGRASGIAIAGITSGGVLDTGFGTGGRILIFNPTGTYHFADAMMLDDGSFLVFYQFLQSPSTHTPILAKYTATGQPDPNFNADLRLSGLFPTQSLKIAPDTNGKIYALVSQAGVTSLIRIMANGSRDASFGTDGVRLLDLRRLPAQRFFSGLHAIGGKILVTGSYENAGSFEDYGFAARFDSDTNIDRTFGLQGVARIAVPGGSSRFTRSLIQPDGRILLAGSYTFLGSYALLIRLTSRGKLDSSFGSGGISLTSNEDVNVINGLTLTPDGHIIAAGSSQRKTFPSVQHFFVARFSSNGIREAIFPVEFISGRDAGGADVALQGDGKYVACGLTNSATVNFGQLAVARLVP